ncbi:hypothetical protein AZA_68961 [Nitrospirillum viridazoti Y2]|nr:hypothetical protein AZA_68961 [Nitrospirillum amazonense Y2]
MAALRVYQAVLRPATHHHAHADARAHGHVDMAVQAPRRPPPAFAHGSAVDVGVDGDGNPQGVGQVIMHRRARPPWLGGTGDAAVFRAKGIQLQGPEAGDAHGVQAAHATAQFAQRFDAARQRFLRRGGGDADGPDGLRPPCTLHDGRAHDGLGAAQFHRPDALHALPPAFEAGILPRAGPSDNDGSCRPRG